jgi:choline dehydrogenase
LTIRARALVDRVLLNGYRAVGLSLESVGGHNQVFGQQITLSGGAIGTPSVLLRSGIGPADDLRRLGIAPVLDLPGVGANLIDHAGVGVDLTITNDSMTADSPLWQILLRCTAPGSAEQNDLLIFVAGGQRASRLSAKLMRPHSRGVLCLADPNPHRQPTILLNLAADPEDERRLVEGVRLVLALANTPDLAQHSGVVILDDGRELTAAEAVAAMQEDQAAADYVRRTVSHYVHPVGTARMGPVSDAGAVVDQYGRVHGIEGLRVPDASIMPNIPRANTNLTCIMIGERIAGWMRQV